MVNDRLLDCSDAHDFSDSSEKDRIGNSLTWIKADTTFEGLRQTLFETDRIFVGDNPPKRFFIQQNSTKFIDAVSILKVENAECNEQWFNNELMLNSDLVAIIGNKGNGKSALADIIGLLGNSLVDQHYFSFLHPTQFCQSGNRKSKDFRATLTWHSKRSNSLSLSDHADVNVSEYVRYIPQNYFEVICNDMNASEDTSFDKELKKVIYSHVSIVDRLGKDTLDALISYKTSETEVALTQLRGELSIINSRIADMELRLESEYRNTLQKELKKREDQLQALENEKPIEISSPKEIDNDNPECISEILESSGKIENLRSQIMDEENLAKQNALELSRLELVKEKIENFEVYFEAFRLECESLLSLGGLLIADIVEVKIDKLPLNRRIKKVNEIRTNSEKLIDFSLESSLASQLVREEQRLEDIRAKLDEPNRLYQIYLQQLSEWEERKKMIEGDENIPDTIIFLRERIREIDDIPSVLKELKIKRREVSQTVFQKIVRLSNTYSKLYEPVQEFIKTHRLAKDKFALNFDVSIIDAGFGEHFFDAYISHAVAGSFCGVEEGKKVLEELISLFDFNSEDDALKFPETIIEKLSRDDRGDRGERTKIKNQLKKNRTLAELYDYLFSYEYLVPRYVLKMGDKEISQLSPGEKGSLLLVFYLLVDKDDIPLIIDQPEHNLDNETVYALLVDCIKEAKQKRQVIIVTHNPNLAVVCDAEQIIVASLDKTNGNRIEYKTGAIENPEINRRIIDILEGTRPAFDKRRFKYME